MASEIREILHRLPQTLRVGSVTGGLCEYTSIQTAIDYADSQTGDWVILIYPGTYDEGDIAPSGGADITLKAMGRDRTVIAPTAAPATAVIVSGFNLTLEDLTIIAPDATRPAIRISNNTLVTDSCTLNGVGAGDAVQMVGGAWDAFHTRIPIGDIDLSTAICTLTMEDCFLIANPIRTAGAFAHNITLKECDLGGQSIVSAATGATSLHMRGCANIGTVTNAGTGIFLIYDCYMASVNQSNAAGSIQIYGGNLLACAGAAGSVTWKTMAQQYEVIAGMVIGDAITAAAADTPAPAATDPYTILIHPGIYDEAVTCSSWVNLKGVGPKGSVVIYQANANIVTSASNVHLQNFTIRLGAPAASRTLLNLAASDPIRATDIIFECTTPGAQAFNVLLTGGACNVVVENCYYSIGGTGAINGLIAVSVDGAVVKFVDNDFTFTNINAHFFNLASAVTATITGEGNRWDGTCAMFNNTTASAITLDGDKILCTAAWTNTDATIALRNCVIESAVVAGNLAVVRMKNCSYRVISRAGTGNIVDESPWLSDAPWKVHKWNWMTALASADIAVRGNPMDAGSGQVLLEVTDNVAGQEAVEKAAEAAGSLRNDFRATRTPRFITQISVDSFDAHVTMFFGIRETLGNAVPAVIEHYAGFAWDGTNFKAISSSGIEESTNLTTPTVGVQVELELISFAGKYVEFYVDGVLVATHNNRQPNPAGGLDWQHLLATAGAGVGDLVQVTVRNGGCQECPA